MAARLDTRRPAGQPAMGACWERGLTCETECLLSLSVPLQISPSPKTKAGGPKGLLFSLPQANLWVWSPLEVGLSCARVGHVHTHARMHARKPASFFEEVFPQGRKEVLGHPALPFSRGHFWGSRSLADTSLSLAMGVGRSWGPALQLGGIFQKGQGRGWSLGPSLQPSQGPPDPPLPLSWGAPSRSSWAGWGCRRSGFIALRGGRGHEGSERLPASALAAQAQPLALRSMHTAPLGTERRWGRTHARTLAKPAARFPDPPPPQTPVRPLQSLLLPAGLPSPGVQLPARGRSVGLLLPACSLGPGVRQARRHPAALAAAPPRAAGADFGPGLEEGGLGGRQAVPRSSPPPSPGPRAGRAARSGLAAPRRALRRVQLHRLPPPHLALLPVGVGLLPLEHGQALGQAFGRREQHVVVEQGAQDGAHQGSDPEDLGRAERPVGAGMGGASPDSPRPSASRRAPPDLVLKRGSPTRLMEYREGGLADLVMTAAAVGADWLAGG